MMLETIARPTSVSARPEAPKIRTQAPGQPAPFKGIRYGLEGALVGVALVGLLDILHGVRLDHVHLDLVGAAIGFASVLTARFFLKQT